MLCYLTYQIERILLSRNIPLYLKDTSATMSAESVLSLFSFALCCSVLIVLNSSSSVLNACFCLFVCVCVCVSVRECVFCYCFCCSFYFRVVQIPARDLIHLIEQAATSTATETAAATLTANCELRATKRRTNSSPQLAPQPAEPALGRASASASCSASSPSPSPSSLLIHLISLSDTLTHKCSERARLLSYW